MIPRVLRQVTAGMITGALLISHNVIAAEPEPPATQPGTTQPNVAASAEEVRPLKEGARAPALKLLRPDGETVNLAELYAAKPSVLIFYRGGWCPYCNAHLGQIAKAEKDLTELGYQVIAISPDKPESLRDTVKKQEVSYQLLSDSDMALAQAFGVAFRVDELTIERYREFGIDLERASGRTHRLLPVPAVYIIDSAGIIRFAHWNADYKQRLNPDDILAAARRIVQPKSG